VNITYERNVDHCSPTTYAKIVTIKEISPAENSDFLEKITFEELGWNCLSQRKLYKIGDKVLFIPPESVLPFELGELLGVTKHLSKGRVKVAKLRGNRSEGLIVEYDKAKPYLSYIMKWEDPPSTNMRGAALPRCDISPHFEKFYVIPNILNEPDIFRVGDKIYHSEKIHGINIRCGKLRHPVTEKYQLYVGSHTRVFKESKTNLYWQVVNEKLEKRLPENILFFGEIFGTDVQHLHYDRKHPDILLFAAMENDKYMPIHDFLWWCIEYDLPHVEFHFAIYESLEQIKALADSPSELTNSHMREGVVVTSVEHPEKMAKCVGSNYLTNRKRRMEI
jgi:RNA ligase (TIGR02306 family)